MHQFVIQLVHDSFKISDVSLDRTLHNVEKWQQL